MGITLTKEIKDKIDSFFDKISPEELIDYVEKNYGSGLLKDEEDFPGLYCKVCGACGEDGCCSALMCKQHKNGVYCEWYLKELKFAYAMFKDIYPLLDEKETEDIFNKNFDKYLK